MPTKMGRFKGHPIITLIKNEDDPHPFTFGLMKAKLILLNIDDIKRFVKEHTELGDQESE
jgi:hypothetical protein